jgi:hypothetical protein
MSEHAEDTRTISRGVPDHPRGEINPYFVALWLIVAACAITGIVLLAVGASMAQTFADQTFGTIKDTGIGQTMWGASFLGVATTAILILIGAAATRWKP